MNVTMVELDHSLTESSLIYAESEVSMEHIHSGNTSSIHLPLSTESYSINAMSTMHQGQTTFVE